jgi:hypothetical protein
MFASAPRVATGFDLLDCAGLAKMSASIMYCTLFGLSLPKCGDLNKQSLGSPDRLPVVRDYNRITINATCF